jgi:hypothetical protein
MKRGALVVWLAACGGPGAHPGVDASTGVDAASTTRHGTVTLSNGTENGAPDASTFAVFVDGPLYGPTVGTDGPCTAYDSPPQKGGSAGTITITGTTPALTLTPMGTAPMVDYVASPLVQPGFFAAGAMIQVQASGAEFPAFSATVTAPSTLAGFTPPASISRAAGASLMWTAGGTGEIEAVVFGTNGSSTAIVCLVPDNGSYTIAPSTLALLSSATTKAAIGLARTAITHVTSGDTDVDVSAGSTITKASVTITP